MAKGKFLYRITPVFMDAQGVLTHGEAQTVELELRRETVPGFLNVTYTRGFVASQAFVEKFDGAAGVKKLLPAKAAQGLDFKPSHEKADEAYEWMGFEAREAILDVLDAAIKDKKASVSLIAYDLNMPEIVDRLEALGSRLRVIVDDSDEHGAAHSAETAAAKRLAKTAGGANVKRMHMDKLQHNKMIVVTGGKTNLAVCGSTNFSWRGFYVQANNAIVFEGAEAVAPFLAAFDQYWTDAKGFKTSPSSDWQTIKGAGPKVEVIFTPQPKNQGPLAQMADDIASAKSSLFYSLAFLSQTPGAVKQAIAKAVVKPGVFVYGISDKKTGELDLQKPDGKKMPVPAFSAALGKNPPEPFKSEPAGGGGVRMHHKFVVVDFDKPSARVYMGSHNFSKAADESNGENLLRITDRRIAVSYMIEALRIFDHYHFRGKRVKDAAKSKSKLHLAKPPTKPSEKAWWEVHYTDPVKIQDRELFSGG